MYTGYRSAMLNHGGVVSLATIQPPRSTAIVRNRPKFQVKCTAARNDIPSATKKLAAVSPLSKQTLEFPATNGASHEPLAASIPSSTSNGASNGATAHAEASSNSAQQQREREAIAKSLQKLKADVNSLTVSSSSNIAPKSTLDQPPEAGVVPEALLTEKISNNKSGKRTTTRKKTMPPVVAAPQAQAAPLASMAAAADASTSYASTGLVYPPEQRNRIRSSWNSLMRWSRFLRNREALLNPPRKLEKVVVFGGGSFGTAMGVALARSYPDISVVLLLRDAYVCRDINELHCNTRYLKDEILPDNVTATTSAVEAITGAQYAIHAVPVQHTRAFLESIKDILPVTVPIISVSKGIEVATGQLMSDLIPSALGRKQPAAFLSGPSFASEVIKQRPTGIVAASRDLALVKDVQQLFASPSMRVNTSTDVVGVEICGALKNVLAIAAGIVEGLDLGHNAMAALIAQGCSEIRWLAERMGAKSSTVSGLSGLGDIMLTCYGSLSRNRSVGVRLGQGEKLPDILASSSQVAEGVATAAVVVSLALKYRVQLPVLTAVAQVLDGHISAKEAVLEIMSLPQIEER